MSSTYKYINELSPYDRARLNSYELWYNECAESLKRAKTGLKALEKELEVYPKCHLCGQRGTCKH